MRSINVIRSHISRGISVIEVLLSLSIIALILVMAIRYYASTHANLQATQAQSQINRLVKAGYEWQAEQRQSNFSGISFSVLEAAGLVSANDTNAPWGTAVFVGPGVADPTHVLIRLSGAPQGVCQILAGNLATVAYTGSCSTSTYSGEF